MADRVVETIAVGRWVFFLEQQGAERFLRVPDRGGAMDSFPAVPAQLAWTEAALVVVKGLTQIWPTTWRVSDDAVSSVRAVLDAAQRLPPLAALDPPDRG